MSVIFKANKSTKNDLTTPLLSSHEIAALGIQASQVEFSSLTPHQQFTRDAGWLPTKALGSGMDYAESREYQQGDDPRYINWRLSARSNETYVKTYHMEARPSLCLVLDMSRTMVFGTQKRLKLTQAVRLATLIAHISQQQDLNLSVILLSDGNVEWLGKQNLDSLLARINHIPTDLNSNTNFDFQELIQIIQNELVAGSMVYLLSDFMQLEESDINAFSQLQEAYFIQALHIIDQAEQKLPKSGGMCLQAFNENKNISLNSDNNDSRLALDDVLKQHADRIKQSFKQSGLKHTQVFTQDDVLHSFVELPFGH